MATGQAAPTVPHLKKRSQMRARWSYLPLSDKPGFIRAVFPSIAGTSFTGRIVYLPRGQGSPLHTGSGENIILHLEGEVVFEFPHHPPDETVEVRPHDILFIPAGTPYRYFNVGTTDALWFTVLSRKDSWPPTYSYEGLRTYSWDELK